LILRSFSLLLLQNTLKHFPVGKLASSKAEKACLTTGFLPLFLLQHCDLSSLLADNTLGISPLFGSLEKCSFSGKGGLYAARTLWRGKTLFG